MADEVKRIVDLNALSDKVDQLFEKIENMIPGKVVEHSQPSSTTNKSDDIGSQVQQALADAKSKDEAAQKEANTEARFKKLEELAERKPRSYSKFTNFMWGSEE